MVVPAHAANPTKSRAELKPTSHVNIRVRARTEVEVERHRIEGVEDAIGQVEKDLGSGRPLDLGSTGEVRAQVGMIVQVRDVRRERTAEPSISLL